MRAPSVALLCLTSFAVVVGGAGIVAQRWRHQRQAWNNAVVLTHGDPVIGQGKITAYGCGGCHDIPGIEGASGKVGPSLKGFAGRTFVAGRLNNTPDNVQAWLVHPRRIDPQTAMPELGVTPGDARDITAYLYTLR
jgi:cytochrome c